jgi:hypothetical protein
MRQRLERCLIAALILLLDVVAAVAGAAHSGWRWGQATRIARTPDPSRPSAPNAQPANAPQRTPVPTNIGHTGDAAAVSQGFSE